MVNALSPEINAPLACNKGFLRDDALLIVTLIQDTYDQESAGSVASWIAALRAAKQADDDAVEVASRGDARVHVDLGAGGVVGEVAREEGVGGKFVECHAAFEHFEQWQ